MISWLVLPRYYIILIEVYFSISSLTNSSNVCIFSFILPSFSQPVNQLTTKFPSNSLSLKFHIIMFLYVTFRQFPPHLCQDHFYYGIWKDYISDCIVLLIGKKNASLDFNPGRMQFWANVCGHFWVSLDFFLGKRVGSCHICPGGLWDFTE